MSEKEIYNPLQDFDALINEAIETQEVDMTETGSGGYERIILPAGDYNMRFVEYIEVGKRTPVYNGKPTGRPPMLNVRIGFVIYGPNGEEVKYRTFAMAVSNSEKAKFKILFDRLNRKGDIKHAAQKLGQAFRGEVLLEKKGDKEYNTINWGSLNALPKFDPDTGEAIEIPALKTEDLKLFLWNKPTKETWDSLFIEGTNDKGESKNFIQEDILKAVDYVGSPLQSLLEGGVPTPESLAAPSATSAPVETVAPAAPAAPTAPTAPVAPSAPKFDPETGKPIV